MTQIVPIQQLTDATLAAYSSNLVSLKQTLTFKGKSNGCFIMLKQTKIIGYGMVEPSTNAPPTAGIGQLNHYFIMPSERRQGHGTALFQYLVQFAKKHFGLLELPEHCPWRQSHAKPLDLSKI